MLRGARAAALTFDVSHDDRRKETSVPNVEFTGGGRQNVRAPVSEQIRNDGDAADA